MRSLFSMTDALQSAKRSAQSPPCSRKRFPAATSASCLRTVSTSSAHTRGGKARTARHPRRHDGEISLAHPSKLPLEQNPPISPASSCLGASALKKAQTLGLIDVLAAVLIDSLWSSTVASFSGSLYSGCCFASRSLQDPGVHSPTTGACAAMTLHLCGVERVSLTSSLSHFILYFTKLAI